MKKHLPAIIAFLILTVIMTFPLSFKITTYIPGFFSTDESYYPIWEAWRIKYSLLHGLPISETKLIAYPFGINIYKGQPIGYIWILTNFALSIFTNPILTYNFQIIINFMLTALFMYFLTYYLTENRWCAVFSGIAFGFSPYMFVRSWQHLGETYLWPMPLLLWMLFMLKDADNLRTRILFVISFVLTSVNHSDTYYASIILGVLLVYLAIKWNDNQMPIKRIIGLTIIAFVILIPEYFPIFRDVIRHQGSQPSAQNIYHRPFEDLFSQSAKPLSYFLPAVAHPIFGKFTEQFIGTQLYGVSLTEHTLYLGWTPLILAFVAFRRWRKRRRKAKLGIVPFGDSPCNRESFYIGFFISLAIVAWLFSQSPWWNMAGFKLYMPSFFMYKILPMFRAYCRFGIVMMLAVAVLAGFGLKFILERFKTQKTKIVVATLFCGLVLFEFWNYPPFKVIDLSRVPEVYYWLKGQPGDFAIAEYPIDANGANMMHMFYQTKHDKKMINGTIPGTYANKIAKAVTKLSDPKTTKVLKWMGVKYVLVHREDYLRTELIEEIEELDKIPQNPGLKLIKTFPPQECPQKDIMCVQKTGSIDIYEVVTEPIKPEVQEK